MRSAFIVRKPRFFELLAALIILWLNAGVFSFIRPYIHGTVMYLVFGIWLINAMMSKKFQQKLWKLLLEMSMPFLIMACMYFFRPDDLTNTYFKFLVYSFILLCIRDYYYDNKITRGFLLKVWVLDSACVIISTMVQLQVDPLIIRRMSVGAETLDKILGDAIYFGASFSHILCYVFVAIFVLSRIINKDTENKFWYVIAFTSLLTIIASSQIVLLIGAELAGILMLLFLKFERDKRKTLASVVALGLILSCTYLLLPSILSMLVNMNFLPELIEKKLSDILYILDSGSALSAAEINVRIERYLVSIESFRNNMLLGSMGNSATIGAHSTWFDLFGMYGLLALPFACWFVSVQRKNIKCASPKDKQCVIVISCLYVIVGFVDPILFQYSFAFMAIIIPFCTHANSLRAGNNHD